jgi:hypothetical protein
MIQASARVLRSILPAVLCAALLPGTARAVNYNFDGLPFLWNAPAAFLGTPVNFNGGAEVTTQDARSAPHSIMVYGEDLSAQQSHGYFTVYDNVNYVITANTRLEYWVKPLFGSSNFAVDLYLSNGFHLRDYSARDQWGVPIHAGWQGSGRLAFNVYNRVESNIGLWIPAGTVVQKIIVAWDRWPGTGWNNAVFDDISLTETPDCATLGSGCAATVCKSACNETALRAAIDQANACNATGTFRRTINLAPTCSMNVRTNYISPGWGSPITGLGVANCTEESGVFGYAMCLKGHDTTIDGGGPTTTGIGQPLTAATLTYDRSTNSVVYCDADLENAGPPAFLLKGTNNAIRSVRTKYFYEGIVLRSGTGHRVDRLTSDRICDEAVTVGGPGVTPVDATVEGVTLTGFVCDATCGILSGSGPCGSNQRTCGHDKAVQLLSGTNTKILSSSFTNTGKAILMKRGTSLIQGNTLTGPASADYSDSITIDGELAPVGEYVEATINANTITRHKFGIRVDLGASVNATNNVIKNYIVNAFSVRRQWNSRVSELRGAGNKISFSGTPQGCNFGAVATYSDPTALIDFGGGWNGTVGPWGASPGGNVFCQGTNVDFFWRTYSGLSPSTPTCTGSAVEALVSAANNCFSDTGTATLSPIDLNGDVDVSGATGGCNCSF